MRDRETYQLMVDLEEFGYLHAPEVRQFGGPYAMRNPVTGCVVWEKDFEHELNEVLMNNRPLKTTDWWP